MLQITPQMRILVAMEAVDGRKGHRRTRATVPRETGKRSVFRLRVHFPQPQRQVDPTVSL